MRIDIERIENALNYSFKNKELLIEALTHSSYKNENKTFNDNERLEFFGDSILGFLVAEHLFIKLKGLPEGTLTKYRAKIVCEETLSEIALKMNIGDYIRFGKGELITGGKKRPSILADSLEALIGAIYLDSDIETIKEIVLNILSDKINLAINGKLILDYKTALQELIQKKSFSEINYYVVEEFGPDHNKAFIMAVDIDGKFKGQGRGKNKKEAEQNAAKNALEMGLKK